MRKFLSGSVAAMGALIPFCAVGLPRNALKTWLVLIVLLSAASPVLAGQLYFPFGNSFGPNDSVEVFGTVGFVTDCPPEGIPDGWPHGVYPIGDIYVLRDGAIDGYSGDTLTDISGIPNTVVGGPSFVEIVAYTAPGGNLGAGDYDLVLDECQDGYYDPAVDFMLGMGDDIAFVVAIPTDIPSFDIVTIQNLKEDAYNEALHWTSALSFLDGVTLSVQLVGISGITSLSAAVHYLINEKLNPVKLVYDGFQDMIDNLLLQKINHWLALAADPPDTNFTELEELSEIVIIHPETDLGMEVSLVYLANEAVEQAAILSALIASLERFQGARDADNRDYALLQAGQIKGFADLLAVNLEEMNSAINVLIQEIQNTGIDFTAYANELVDLQNMLAAQGLTQDEVWELKSLGLTDEQIEEALLNFLNEDFSLFLSGDVITQLQLIQAANLSTTSSLESLVTDAIAVSDSLSQLVELKAPVSEPGGPYSGVEGSPILFDGSGSYDPNDDPIVFAWELNGDALFDDGSTATPEYTYYAEQIRLVGLRVSDTTGLSHTKYTSITVTNVNNPPVIDSSFPGNPALLVFAEDTLNFRIWASDPDGEIVNYTWTVNDSLVNIQDSLIFVADSSAIGLSVVSVSISDGNLLSRDIIKKWGVLVMSQNQAPVITSIPDTNALVGVEYSYDADASDADGDSLIYSLDVFPSGMAIDGTTGVVTWLPSIDQVGTQQVTLIVDDGRGGTVSQNFTVSVYSQEPLFAPAVTVGGGNYPNSIVSADLNRDGNQDLAWINGRAHSVAVAMGNGDCSFQPSVEYPTGTYYPISLISSDLDADGSPDLMVVKISPDVVCVLMNRGDGTFASPVDYPVGTRPISVFAADLDGDSDSDLAVTNTQSHNVSILMNNGDGTFRPAVNYAAPEGVWFVFAADYDRDGDYDLAVTSRLTTVGVYILMNNGDGTFGLPIAYGETFGGGGDIFSADFDSDGDYDLVITPDVVRVLMNRGDGTFASPVDYPVGTHPGSVFAGSVFAADLDGDSDYDLAVTDRYSRNIFILTNNGNGSFEFHGIYVSGYSNIMHPFVIGADFDKDGDNDLAVACTDANEVVVLMNLSDPISATKGSLSGYVSYDSSGFPGVPIDLFDSAGYIVASALSDDSGWYQFMDLENGHYSVSLSTPLGYRADEETKAVEVLGLQYEVNFELTKLDVPMAQRGRGYWMHQVNALLSGKGNPQETYDDMCDYMELIRTHFNEHQLNPVNIFSIDLESDCDKRMEALRTVISPKPKSSMNDKAKAHLTTLLLNMVSGKIALWEYISEDSATVSQVITYCNALITDIEPENDETAKNIAEMINEGQTVPAGMIDLATANIAYKQSSDESLPTEFSLGQNFPNPFNPTTEISFSLPSASHVKLEVFNVMGQKVTTLVDGRLEAGEHIVPWDGSKAASGVYLYRLQADNFVDTKKMILLK